MTEYLYVFSYDISAAKSRRRVAARLESSAVRVQDSVFETRMTPKAAKALAAQLEPELGEGDSLKVYAIGHAGLSRSMSFGAALPPLSGTFVLA